MLNRLFFLASILCLGLGQDLLTTQPILADSIALSAIPNSCSVAIKSPDTRLSDKMIAQSESSQNSIIIGLGSKNANYQNQFTVLNTSGQSSSDIQSLSFDKASKSIVVKGLAGETSKIPMSKVKEILISTEQTQPQQQVQARCYSEFKRVQSQDKKIKIPASEFNIQSNQIIFTNLDKTSHSKGKCYTPFKSVSVTNKTKLEATKIAFNSKQNCFDVTVHEVEYQEHQICSERNGSSNGKPLQ
jgi:hypothetical protein